MSKPVFRMKDFSIKSIYIGSRLQGGPQYRYEIYYHAPNGQTVRLNETCYTKVGAREYIRRTIRIAKALKAKRDAEANIAE